MAFSDLHNTSWLLILYNIFLIHSSCPICLGYDFEHGFEVTEVEKDPKLEAFTLQVS